MKNIKQFNKSIIFIALTMLISSCAALSGRETVGEYIDDATVTSKVKSSIIDDPALKAFQISVETFQGTVQLRGFVDSKEEAKKAEADAWEVSGVRAVKNNIIVRKPKRKHR